MGIFTSSTPLNATRSLDKLFRLIAAFKANSIQDADEIKSLREKINHQDAVISTLQKKVEQLKLSL